MGIWLGRLCLRDPWPVQRVGQCACAEAMVVVYMIVKYFVLLFVPDMEYGYTARVGSVSETPG